MSLYAFAEGDLHWAIYNDRKVMSVHTKVLCLFRLTIVAANIDQELNQAIVNAGHITCK